MARFLLIHGSAHGAWCWRDVIPLLQAQGHEAAAIDLPGHGADQTPLADVTLDQYVRRILEHLTPGTTLVGHSMAGFPISAAAMKAPDMIHRLVYLCAHVPRDGVILSELRKLVARQPLMPAIRMAPDGLSFTFDPKLAKTIFYDDCSPNDIRFALDHLTPQPVKPQATPLFGTKALDRLNRHYILCEKDNAVPAELQELFIQDWPAAHVHRLPSGHSPFFAMPDRLARLLNTIVQS
jgi:pimeloyl-ACP methyl ester carboxylesterase